MAIVTISSEIGTGAHRIGKALASRLGYRFVDREIVGHAAQQYGLGEGRLCHLDEERPSFLERFDVETLRNLAVLQTVFYGFAERNDVVLMGHCGQWLLRGIPHVLRVRLVARFSLRVKRMEATLATQPERKMDPRHATHLVRQRDADKVARVRDLYDVDVRDPALYDLVINDGALTPETVVDLIAAVVGRPE